MNISTELDRIETISRAHSDRDVWSISLGVLTGWSTWLILMLLNPANRELFVEALVSRGAAPLEDMLFPLLVGAAVGLMVSLVVAAWFRHGGRTDFRDTELMRIHEELAARIERVWDITLTPEDLVDALNFHSTRSSCPALIEGEPADAVLVLNRETSILSILLDGEKLAFDPARDEDPVAEENQSAAAPIA